MGSLCENIDRKKGHQDQLFYNSIQHDNNKSGNVNIELNLGPNVKMKCFDSSQLQPDKITALDNKDYFYMPGFQPANKRKKRLDIDITKSHARCNVFDKLHPPTRNQSNIDLSNPQLLEQSCIRIQVQEEKQLQLIPDLLIERIKNKPKQSPQKLLNNKYIYSQNRNRSQKPGTDAGFMKKIKQNGNTLRTQKKFNYPRDINQFMNSDLNLRQTFIPISVRASASSYDKAPAQSVSTNLNKFISEMKSNSNDKSTGSVDIFQKNQSRIIEESGQYVNTSNEGSNISMLKHSRGKSKKYISNI